MTKKYIPGVGETFTGHVPGVKKVLHVTYGPDTAADVSVTDCGTFELVNVNHPIIVWSVKAFIETAFTASVTATIGDCDDTDRYMAAGTIADTTVDTALQGDSLAAPFWDTTGLNIDAVIAGATPAVGLAHIFVEYSADKD
jgi:hypothetical protein